jgi:hypothetical protein
MEISMLSIDDFDISDIHPHLLILSSDLAQNQQQLAIICIEMAKLYVCIGNLLSTRFYPKAINDPEISEPMGMTLQPVFVSHGSLQNNYIENELLLWFLSLPPEADLGTQLHEIDGGQIDISLVHRGFLHLVYYACREACCPIPFTTSIDEEKISQNMTLKSKRKYFASSSVMIVKKLQDKEVVQYLLPTAAPILLPTIVEQIRASHFDMKGNDSAPDDVDYCLGALEALQDRYNVVGIVLAFVKVCRQRIGRLTNGLELVSDSDLDIKSSYQQSLCYLNEDKATPIGDREQVESVPRTFSLSPPGNDGTILDLDDFLNLHDQEGHAIWD